MKINSFLKSIGFILIYVVFLAFNDVIIYEYRDASFAQSNIIYTISNIIVVLPFIYVFRTNLKDDLIKMKKNFKKYSKIILKYWLIGLIIMMASNFVINNYILNNTLAANEEYNRLLLFKYPIYMIISVGLLSPIIEEILFRLNFKDTFNKRKLFIISTGLLFALMHIMSSTSIQELWYLIPYTSLGITFSAIYYDTKNIYSSMFAHILHNAITLIIIFLGI